MDLSWLCIVAVLLIMIPVIYYGITSRWNYGKQLSKALRTGTSRSRKATKTMNKQQEGLFRNLIIRRDSVAAGDDVLAPHEKIVKVKNDESIENTLGRILASHYLPGIHGGKATWIVVGKNPIAVVAQQWSKPHYLIESLARTETLVDFANDHQLEFRYWCQVEPKEVVARLEQEKLLPDKYGRDKK